MIYNSRTKDALQQIMHTLAPEPGHPLHFISLPHFVLLADDFLTDQHLHSLEELAEKITLSDFWRNKFLAALWIEDTELFRDQSFWRYLKEQLLNEPHQRLRVGFPELVGGEELYSFLVTCAMHNCLDRVEVHAHATDAQRLENIRHGFVSSKNFSLNVENYKRWNPFGYIEDHFVVNMNKLYLKPELLLPVHFSDQCFFRKPPQEPFWLLMYRNKMIYFDELWQNQALSFFHDSLQPGGFLALGINENMHNSSLKFKFEEYYPPERIYRRK